MCMNCGCGEIDERHGNQGNIVLEDVRRAATASGLDMSATVKNLQTSLGRVGEAGMAGSGASAQSSGMGRVSRDPDVPHV